METTFETPKPKATEPTARLTDPANPEPMPVVPAPAPHPLLTLDVKTLGAALEQLIRKTLAYAESQPRASLSPADLAEIVLDNLRRRFARKKIPASEIRQVLNIVCKEKVDLVGHAIYPKHILRLGKTDFFVFRENELRPLEYQGLIPDSSGVLPDEPMPF